MNTYDELERLTYEQFRLYFETFWANLGRGQTVSDVMIKAYWEKLREFPGLFIRDVFEEYLNYNVSESKDIPTAAYFVSHCISKKTAYSKPVEAPIVRTDLSETWRRCLMTGTRILLTAHNNKDIADAGQPIRNLQIWLNKLKAENKPDDMIAGIKETAKKYKIYLDPAWPETETESRPVVSAGINSPMTKLGDAIGELRLGL
jgi:hypothetical protein